jgi:hypothetical protein
VNTVVEIDHSATSILIAKCQARLQIVSWKSSAGAVCKALVSGSVQSRWDLPFGETGELTAAILYSGSYDVNDAVTWGRGE